MMPSSWSFHLESAIQSWRQQMISAGISNRDAVDELESHLRDEIELQMRSGRNAVDGFDAAIQKMGNASMLKAEFNRENQNKIMKRILIISSGIVCVLVGMAFVMPAVAQYHHEGAMLNNEPWLFLLGSLLTLAGLSAGILGARKRNA